MIPLDFISEWKSQAPWISTYALDELLGTKLRALYQRKKGRDLFDLWWASQHKAVDLDRVVHCFGQYLGAEDRRVSRAELEENLAAKLSNRRYLDDLQPLLAPQVNWNPKDAARWIYREVTPRLQGEPWKRTEDFVQNLLEEQ